MNFAIATLVPMTSMRRCPNASAKLPVGISSAATVSVYTIATTPIIDSDNPRDCMYSTLIGVISPIGAHRAAVKSANFARSRICLALMSRPGAERYAR